MCIRDSVKPVFVEKNIEILSARILGKNKNVLKMQVQDAPGTQIDAMYFGDVEAFLEFFREKYGKPAVDGLLRGQRSKVCLLYTSNPSDHHKL